LWENHRIEDVASPEGFQRNPQMVLDFYNARRKQLQKVEPNEAHLLLAKLEEYFEVHIITQNVDDLHERGGSSRIIHLHGELKKARPIDSESETIVWEKDLNLGDLNSKGVQLRPHIVWFGEMVPEMDQAVKIAETADIFLVIGTSMQVYPAASLIQFIPDHCEVFVIDPNLDQNFVAADHFLKTSATDGMRKLIEILLK
jgi:NAD-dependent deacetylase